MTSSNKLSLSTLLILGGMLIVRPAYSASPSLLFSPDNITTSPNSSFTVNIEIDTTGFDVSGAGARIVYDPSFLRATSILTGSIFTDYPAASMNNDQGLATISGIVSSPVDLYRGRGTFASITFEPKSIGQTKVTYHYVPGDTTDSNIAVMRGNGDILGAVNELSINIVQANTISDQSPQAQVQPSASPTTLNLQQSSLIRKVASSLGLTKVVDQYAASRPGRAAVTTSTSTDPLAPITRQDPITDPSTTQPPTTTARAIPTFLVPLLLGLIFILLVVILWTIFGKRKQDDPTPLL